MGYQNQIRYPVLVQNLGCMAIMVPRTQIRAKALGWNFMIFMTFGSYCCKLKLTVKYSISSLCNRICTIWSNSYILCNVHTCSLELLKKIANFVMRLGFLLWVRYLLLWSQWLFSMSTSLFCLIYISYHMHDFIYFIWIRKFKNIITSS